MVITILFLRNCFVSLLLISSLFFSSSPVLAKSLHPISDAEIRQKKLQCYADIDSGMWGWPCKSSMIARENCALRCLSPACYELIYESDPLEEGEKDLIRSQEYKYCSGRFHCLQLLEQLASKGLIVDILSAMPFDGVSKEVESLAL